MAWLLRQNYLVHENTDPLVAYWLRECLKRWSGANGYLNETKTHGEVDKNPGLEYQRLVY